MQRYCRLWVVLIVAVTVTAACVPLTPAPQPSASPLASPTLPGASQTSDSSLPVPAAIPTAPANAGVVTGSLRRQSDGSVMQNIIVYAALIDRKDNYPMASVDPASDPQAITDATGQFIFPHLPPAEYLLVAQTPTGLLMLSTTEKKSIIYQAVAGQVTKLGELKVNYEYPNG